MSEAAAQRQGFARHHGRHVASSLPDACSVLWDKAEASALGTAPPATFWVALEQNGPWGAQAATQSHLDPDLGQLLTRSCQDAGGRFILIRRPGPHPDLRNSRASGGVDGTREVDTHRVYLAGGLADRPWLLEADLDDPARLAELTAPILDGLPAGGIPAAQLALPELTFSTGPVLMICTNTRRDLCCSVRGRPVALAAEAQRPGQVWECSHTGGHRFAPTGVLLPHGQTFGRLSATTAVAAVDAARRSEVPMELLGPTYDRGRSHLAAPGQAAESMVRHQVQEPLLPALSTTVEPRPGQEDAWQCEVTHVDGRRWNVTSVRRPGGEDLPESCGNEPVPRWQWSVVNDSGR